MDFALTDEEQALADLTEHIVADNVTNETLRSLEATEERLDRATWKTLAGSGVLGALLPKADGGAGLGAVATGAVLETATRHAAALPVLSTIVMGAQPVAAFGSAEMRERVLPGVIDGSRLMAAVTGGVSASGGVLNGSSSFVIGGLEADVLVVQTVDEVFAIEADRVGVSTSAQNVTTGYPDAIVTFADVAVSEADRLGGPEVIEWMRLRTEAGICAMTAGLCQGALALAADYTKERQQFNRVIASFQAVSQRVADAYIDLQGIELTSRQAAWRLDTGRSAEREVAIARWWAADASNRIVHAAVHVHGGVGVDRDYPLHRHFLLARKLELTLGSAEHHLAQIGSTIAQ